MQLAPYTTVDIPGARWRLSDTGSGHAIVLLHGFPDTPQSWTAIATHFADRGYRVVIPYLPGYHPDTVVAGKPRSTTELAGLLVGLLDELGIGQAVLAGHDWGADIIYRTYVTAPGRVRGLVPIAIPHPASVSLSPSLLWKGRHFVNLRVPPTAARVRRADFRYLEVLYERWAPDWFGLEQQGALARVKTAFSDPSVLDAAIGYYRTVSLLGSNNGFRLGGPGLIVAGANDLVPISAFEKTAQRWDGDIDLLVVPGAGHWPHLEHQPMFINALTAFLGRLAS